MEFTPWDEMSSSRQQALLAALVDRLTTYGADTTMALIREAMNAKDITFEQALMALLISESRNLDIGS